MMQRVIADFIRFTALVGLLTLAASEPAKADPPEAAVTAFNRYIGGLEARLARQHSASHNFLAPVDEARRRRGELIVENLTPAGTELPGAMLHHWRGTAFVPGATAAEFERLMKDFNQYPQHYAPQVLAASVLAQQGDHLQATMRVRQQHIITVVMDTSYDVTFARLDAQHGYSISRSTRIAEIDSPGTPKERALGAGEEHGFLWRLNTYWSYEERDGGVYMQIESVTLTRGIPRGLGWAVAPFVESVPRESLEFTLRSTCTALRR
jgi:hypothetical protein